MPENLSWGLIAVAALLLCLVFNLLHLYLRLHHKAKRREILSKERLAAISSGRQVADVVEETDWRASLSKRIVDASEFKFPLYAAIVALSSGIGVGLAFGLLPECYVLHDYWSFGFIGAAPGLGLLIYTLCLKPWNKK
jgi:hypothetical protein